MIFLSCWCTILSKQHLSIHTNTIGVLSLNYVFLFLFQYSIFCGVKERSLTDALLERDGPFCLLSFQEFSFCPAVRWKHVVCKTFWTWWCCKNFARAGRNSAPTPDGPGPLGLEAFPEMLAVPMPYPDGNSPAIVHHPNPGWPLTSQSLTWTPDTMLLLDAWPA